MLGKRLRGETFPPCKFSLGAAGIPINLTAIVFLLFTFVFLFFPAGPDPKPADMNWGIVIYGGANVLAFTWYFVRGRHEYEGPVNYVRKDM